MTKPKRHTGGWITRAERERRGASGYILCRWCGRETPGPRRTFCSAECVHEWRIRSSASYARRQVEKRDCGVCAACGFDAGRLRRIIEIATCLYRDDQQRAGHRSYWQIHGGPRAVVMGALGLRPTDHTWEADHIVPVAEGGGSCGLDNLRTLCRWCHVRETRELRRRLAGRPAPLLREQPDLGLDGQSLRGTMQTRAQLG